MRPPSQRRRQRGTGGTSSSTQSPEPARGSRRGGGEITRLDRASRRCEVPRGRPAYRSTRRSEALNDVDLKGRSGRSSPTGEPGVVHQAGLRSRASSSQRARPSTLRVPRRRDRSTVPTSSALARRAPRRSSARRASSPNAALVESDQPAGLVVSQSPDPGVPGRRRASRSRSASPRGRRPATVPGVIGLDEGSAARRR